MEAQTWAAISLLGAALLGTLFWMGTRLDGIGARVDQQAGRIDEQAARIDVMGERIVTLSEHVDSRSDRADLHFDRMEAHFDRMDARFDQTDERINGLATTLIEQGGRIEDLGRQLGERIYDLAARLDQHLERHAG